MKCLYSALRAQVLVLTFISVSPFAAAQNVVWEGELKPGDGMFNRTDETGSILSFVGTNVYFDSTAFYVSKDGKYTFESFQPESWDGMIFVYSTVFDPTKPLKNWCYGNDGYEGRLTMLDVDCHDEEEGSKIADMTLSSGVQYYAVTTSFYNYSAGEYIDAIGNGPGAVALGTVPEPVAGVPLLLGLAVLKRRRRTR